MNNVKIFTTVEIRDIIEQRSKTETLPIKSSKKALEGKQEKNILIFIFFLSLVSVLNKEFIQSSLSALNKPSRLFSITQNSGVCRSFLRL